MQQTKALKIAVVPGDGIGLEVVPAAIEVIEAACRGVAVELSWNAFDWSCERYVKSGAMMPEDGIDQLAEHDAVFLGAVGRPGVPDHISLWGLLIPIRRSFLQYANVRPIKLFKGVTSPLRNAEPGSIDLVVVRENCEGEYSQMGGRLYPDTADELVLQESVFTRRGVDRIQKHAFELAMKRPRRKVTSATKSNGIFITMPYWDERFAVMAKNYPEVETDAFLIDILTAHFVQHPDWFDVVVGSNLFGDILSDLAAGVAGSIGLAPSANLNPEGDHPSMFEPVHGSAPDIAGKGVANPIAQVWSGAMMLDHLGFPEPARRIEAAIETVLAEGVLTPDLGGKAGTADVTKALIAAL